MTEPSTYIAVAEFVPLCYRSLVGSLSVRLKSLHALDHGAANRLAYRLYWQAKYGDTAAALRSPEIHQIELEEATLVFRLQAIGWVVSAVSKAPRRLEELAREEPLLLDILAQVVAGVPLRAKARLLNSPLSTRDLRRIATALRKRGIGTSYRNGRLTCTGFSRGHGSQVVLTADQELESEGLAAYAGQLMLEVAKIASECLSSEIPEPKAADWVIFERRTLTMAVIGSHLAKSTVVGEVAAEGGKSLNMSGVCDHRLRATERESFGLAMPTPNMLNGPAQGYLLVADHSPTSTEPLGDFEWFLIYLWNRHCSRIRMHFEMEDLLSQGQLAFVSAPGARGNAGNGVLLSESPRAVLTASRRLLRELAWLRKADLGQMRSYVPAYDQFEEHAQNLDAGRDAPLLARIAHSIGCLEKEAAITIPPYEYLTKSPIPLSVSSQEFSFLNRLEWNVAPVLATLRDMERQLAREEADQLREASDQMQRGNLVLQLLLAAFGSFEASRSLFPHLCPLLGFLVTLMASLTIVAVLNCRTLAEAVARLFAGLRPRQ